MTLCEQLLASVSVGFGIPLVCALIEMALLRGRRRNGRRDRGPARMPQTDRPAGGAMRALPACLTPVLPALRQRQPMSSSRREELREIA